MRRVNLYATTALGLCLVAHPGPVAADLPPVSDDDLQMFAPVIQPCIDAPSAMACADAGFLLALCAEDLELARCDVLLRDAGLVLDDPERRARVQEILQAVQTELRDQGDAAALDAPEAGDTAAQDTPQDITEAPADDLPAADPERRAEAVADETLPDDPAAPEAEAEADVVAPEEEVTQEQAADDLPAAEDTPAAAEAAPDTPEAQQQAADALPAEDDAPADSPADTELAPDAPEAMADSAAESAADSDAAAAREEEAAARAEALRAIEQQRERQLSESEAMAEDAPELIVEEAPAEEFIAPVEDAREPDAAQRAALDQMLETPEVAAAMGLLGAALGLGAGAAEEETADDPRPAAALAARDGTQEADDAADETAEVIEEEITAGQLRSSRDDFDSRLSMDFDPVATSQADGRGRRDLERAGLAALGALAVGMIINQNRVVARSDERVVVDQGGGDLQLWRDDDAILLQDGSTRRIERYSDGSTRTRWDRLDGTQVITIRDATGRVLRRERMLGDGTLIELIDDTREVRPIIVSELPPLRTRELRISQRTDPELALAMLREAEADARAMERSFSLRQIRETRELRELLPLLSTDPITFETNRANVRAEEASKLLQVGRLMERLVLLDPREVFLIEGHTDATGPAAFNLALSDRRAESVALALTEFFYIPPENLVVQGYGKRYLKIPTLASEERNRRVAIRRITPLIGR